MSIPLTSKAEKFRKQMLSGFPFDIFLPMETVGRMADGTEVAQFTFTWAVKRKGVKDYRLMVKGC